MDAEEGMTHIRILDELQNSAEQLVDQFAALRKPLTEQTVRIHLYKLPERNRKHSKHQYCCCKRDIAMERR